MIMNIRDVGIKKKIIFLALRILLHLGNVDEDVYRGVCREHQVVPPAQSFEFGSFHLLFVVVDDQEK